MAGEDYQRNDGIAVWGASLVQEVTNGTENGTENSGEGSVSPCSAWVIVLGMETQDQTELTR